MPSLYSLKENVMKLNLEKNESIEISHGSEKVHICVDHWGKISVKLASLEASEKKEVKEEKLAHSKVAIKLTDIIIEHTGVDKPENGVFSNNTTKRNIGTDSLDDIGIIMSIEEKFEIELTDENVEDIDNFKDLVDLVEKLIAGNG